jgi:Domain of unknown function (DUF4440)
MRIPVRLAVLLCLAGAAAAEPPSDAAPVIAAERAFAERAAQAGWIQAFRDFTAPDGQVAAGAIVSAPATFAVAADTGDRSLYWWPAYAGIASSGDLGFTTGPFSRDAARTPSGQFFTVWRLQSDGTWKWIYDGGPGPVSDPPAISPDAPAVPTLPVALRGVGSADDAVSQVTAIEQKAGNAAGLAAHLAPDAHVYRRDRPRATGDAASAANFSFPSPAVTYRLVRTEASSAGDLVFTLGEAAWPGDGEPRRGYFARIWQYRPEGWRIVYDQLLARPPG